MQGCRDEHTPLILPAALRALDGFCNFCKDAGRSKEAGMGKDAGRSKEAGMGKDAGRSR